jgi:hypothetical protein
MKKTARRTISLKVYFWTNRKDNKGKPAQLPPKHAWTVGSVHVEANEEHGLRSMKDVKFNSLLQLSSAIEKALKQQGIKLHINRREKVLAEPYRVGQKL